MLAHVLVNGIQIGQETRVHELVELVRADEAHLEGVGNFHHVCRAGPEERDARTREGDLGGRRHAQDAVLVTRLARDVEDVRELVAIVGEIVHGIGVVPHDAEVRGRLARGQATHCLLRVGDAGGVGVLGHAEHALDGIVLGQ